MSSRTEPTGEHELAASPPGALERTLPARPGPQSSARDDVAPVPTEGAASLERYRLLDEVGQGGMAVVYRAHDTALDREVAVKVLHPHLAGQRESRDRLEREAQAVAKLRHENILEIFDYSGRGSDKSFIVTEFIHGTTLRAFMTDFPLPHPELAELIVCEIARALEHAHKGGVIHRDIKPENVMIRADGVLKLCDFGIAQMIDKERMTVTGQLLGSPAYMAPEHVEGGGIDFRTDVFALGILLYQLATGELPFKGRNPHEVLKRIADGIFTPAEKVSPRVGRRLSQVITRALAKSKDDRFPQVAELRAELLSDLADAGFDDPRAEVVRLFTDTKAYCVEAGPRITSALTARGKALRAAGRRAAALELWRRGLEIASQSPELNALVAGVERRRTLARSLVALCASCGLGAAGFMVVTAAHRHASKPVTHHEPVVVAHKAVTPIAVTPAVEHREPAVAHPRVERARAVTPPPAVVVVKRHFELAPTPKAVRVLLDGAPLGDYGPQLEAVDLDPRPHTLTFESDFCYPETVAIDPTMEAGRIVRRLKWRPGALTVTAQPDNAYIIVDGSLVAHSGRSLSLPIPPLSEGRRTVHVKVSAPDREPQETVVELRANETKSIAVTLPPAGTP